jgi:hypothetical protein
MFKGNKKRIISLLQNDIDKFSISVLIPKQVKLIDIIKVKNRIKSDYDLYPYHKEYPNFIQQYRIIKKLKQKWKIK